MCRRPVTVAPVPAVGRFSHVVIDVVDLDAATSFWCAVLDVSVELRWQQYVILAPTVAGGPAVALQTVPEGKTGKNRVHIDLAVADLDAARAAIEALGGRQVGATAEHGITLAIMADPDGNEFCLVRI
jgi:predicted enzyme related to lactoylglutathione lyase